MGQRLSIDKHTSTLEDILDLANKNVSHIPFNFQIPNSIT